MTTQALDSFATVLPGGSQPSIPLRVRLKSAARWAVPLLASAALALVTQLAGVPIALAAACALGAGVVLLVWPDAATQVVVVLLYMNIPAVAYKLHNVPQPIAASVFMLLGLPFVHYVVFRRAHPRFDPVLRMMFGFLGVVIVSSVFAVDKGVAAQWIVYFATEGLVTYWLFTTVVRSVATMRRVIYALLVAGALLGSLSIFQGVTKRYDLQFGGLAMRQTKYDDKRTWDAHRGVEKNFYRSDRAEGPMLENNYYAQAMLVLLPLAVFLMRAERRRHRQLAVAGLGVVILVGGVLLTYSRGAVVVMGVLALAAIWLRWVKARYVMAAGVLCIVATLILAPGLVERLRAVGTVTKLKAADQNADADVSVSGRLTEMLAGLMAFRDHPLLGVGPGQYAPFYSLQYMQNPSIKFRDIEIPRPAHCLYVQVAAETGAIGIVLFVAMPAWLIWNLWRERRRLANVPMLADLAAALVLAIVAYHVAGLFLSFAYERYYWFLLALAGSTLAMLRATPRVPQPAGGVR